MNIVIAGASGYIGRALIPRLLEKYPEATITALSRSQQQSEDPRVQWRACDLFSLRSLEEALPTEIDLAYYLVHSMGPTAQMDQGSFADYDLILADNFARILKRNGIRQIIYLGGLVPALPESELSLHLRSRREVEFTFASAKLPLTVFRAGLIIGAAGSSFRILTKLVKRLPVMVCPKWTQTLTTPVDLGHVIEALTSASSRPEDIGKIFDLAGCAPLTYVEMMRETAAWLGKSRKFLTVPFFTPTLSRLWVCVITGSPKELVYPLVASLEHPMIARPSHLHDSQGRPGEVEQRPYRALLDGVNPNGPKGPRPLKRRRFRFRQRTVRSVQRLPLAEGRDAAWVREQYQTWLPRIFGPFIKVKVDGKYVRFCMFNERLVLLELLFNEERSNRDRQLLYITGGRLATKDDAGRLEFRVVLDRRYVLAAIHDFKPSLPWPLYSQTQARLHLWVMQSFGKFLAQAG